MYYNELHIYKVVIYHIEKSERFLKFRLFVSKKRQDFVTMSTPSNNSLISVWGCMSS